MRVRIAILAGLYLTALTTSAWNHSITIDESAHLAAGLSNLQLNRFELYAVNPPLVKMVAALPVLKMHPVTNWSSAGSVYGNRNEFLFGSCFVEQNSSRSISLYRAARIACLPFGILGLWMCYRWGCELHGERGGLLAAALWAFSPLILGHGSLITPDVPAAATGMLAIYRFRIWLNETSVWNAMWLGIFAGIALLTKFTWAPLFPLIGLLGWISWRAGKCFQWSVLRRDLLQLLVTFVAALYVVNALYGFDRSFTKLGEYEFVSSEFTKPSESARPHESDLSGDRVNRFTGTWLGTIPIPLPKLYLQGIDLQRRDFEPGRMGRSYLMGEWKDGGWWYYYIIGLFVKEPLGGLILLAMSLVTWMPQLLAALCRRRSTQMDVNTTDGSPHPAQVPLREYVILLLPAVLVFALVSRRLGSIIMFAISFRRCRSCLCLPRDSQFSPNGVALVCTVFVHSSPGSWRPSCGTVRTGCRTSMKLLVVQKTGTNGCFPAISIGGKIF
ncbi:MAG: glycosyltransferase family 39 protein [Planctomycetaceae bacterium]